MRKERDPSRFLKYISEGKQVQDWLNFVINKSPVCIKNVYKSLVTYLLVLVRERTKNFIQVISTDLQLAELLFEQLSVLYPDKTGLIVNPSSSLNKREIENKVHYKILGQKSFELLQERKLFFLFTISDFDKYETKTSINQIENSLIIKLSGVINLHSLKETLNHWGYERVTTATLPGSYAIRGCIVDIFPWGHENPLRIELDGNKINSIRIFDPMLQRKIQKTPPDRIRIFAPFFNENNSSLLLPLFPSKKISLSIRSGDYYGVYNIIAGLKNNSVVSNSINLDCLKRGPWDIRKKLQLNVIKEVIKEKPYNTFVFINSQKDQKNVLTALGENISIVLSPSSDSFVCDSLDLFFISFRDLKGIPFDDISSTVKSREKIKTYDDFEYGCFLVHEDYGIGKYRGLVSLNTHWGNQDCIKIEFLNKDYIFVPIYNLNFVEKYVGSDRNIPRLSKLGSTTWANLKYRTKKSTESIVKEFIKLYAKRLLVNGINFSSDTSLHDLFESSFPFIDTNGQKVAMKEIKADMERDQPMDRILCGDVGFGKTELAIRSSFKAVYDNKVVVVLVPTTILAFQHYSSFLSRLGPFGVRVSYISRFTSRSIQKKILRELTDNKIDVIIGTHRLLSNDVSIPNLGLLIIDEEHRFGAKHKEKIKSMRASIDVLSMTATPIPRTLQMSLLGIKNISIIDTAPLERLPIITTTNRYEEKIIKDVINREIDRGGQVYFIHNDIKSIDKVNKKLKEYMPNVQIQIAHGKINSRALESIMFDFIKNKFQVLICTTIIEVGIDIPNVNTIIINNAQNFGLSQLYQMRGRVGRSNRQAYCYLLLPKNETISTEAMTRLKTVEYYTSLGSGYSIAMKDLELRGAGNLFGVEQSGHITSVGTHMYYKILKDTVSEQLQNDEQSFPTMSYMDISYDGEAFIPNNFISELSDRLYFYRKFTGISKPSEVLDISDEIRDRFGPLPKTIKNLISISSFRLSGQKYGIQRLHIKNNGAQFIFNNKDIRNGKRKTIHLFLNRIERLGLNYNISQALKERLKISIDSGGSNISGMELCNKIFDSRISSIKKKSRS